jgi:hypothetical protein
MPEPKSSRRNKLSGGVVIICVGCLGTRVTDGRTEIGVTIGRSNTLIRKANHSGVDLGL